MLKEGIESQYDGSTRDPAPAKGRVARRKAAYASSISTRSMWHQRLDSGPQEKSVSTWA
jgi:hypothetical protein